MRTMYCNPDNIADFTPVDVCIKAMIIGKLFVREIQILFIIFHSCMEACL